MNLLKKKIIYYYILTTAALVIAEGYLFYALFFSSQHFSKLVGVPDWILELMGLFISFLLFVAASYWYYHKISKSILEESRKQVQERNQLFANIAHDLKNPMSSILGFSRALEDGKVSAEEQQAILHIICNKSLQVDDMVRKLFEYAKMETDGYKLFKTNTDLCSIVREVVASMYQQMEEKHMELEISLPDEPVPVEIDIPQFTRVIQNLVANAIKHNEDGTKIGIYLSTKKGVRLIVADTGTPITGQMKEAIFEPFVCSDQSRTQKDGSGLGLAIAKRIVALHRGQLYVEDQISGYTKGFVIEL